MSKAIAGAALIAGGLGIEALLDFTTFGLAAGLTPLLLNLEEGLLLAGASMGAGAIADALTSNRGMNITTRQPAANRQIIYGMQRVGGIDIYSSTTGSHHDQYNFIIVLAAHELAAIEALYLDGRKVWFNPSSSGSTTRMVNGASIQFGGDADHFDHYGPDGVIYNFSGQVYCEARYGNQLPGDVIGAMTANDGHWAATTSGSPYLGGLAYVYLKVEFNPENFRRSRKYALRSMESRCMIRARAPRDTARTPRWSARIGRATRFSGLASMSTRRR